MTDLTILKERNKKKGQYSQDIKTPTINCKAIWINKITQ